MANINPIRRAEIGREKRARTRAQLVTAANSLFANQAPESVTIDDVVRKAGVAKGTFYVHFDGLEALTAAVAEELVQTFDELLQPSRLSINGPVLRIAFGCSSFINKALSDPRWAALVSRMAAAAPKGGELARPAFRRPAAIHEGNSGRRGSPELNLEIVVGIMLQLMRALGEGRLSSLDRDAALSAILDGRGANMLGIRTHGNAAALQSALDRYAFKSEMLECDGADLGKAAGWQA
jgi:AcrR family transcriptional regulator